MAVAGSCVYAKWYLENQNYWGTYPTGVSGFYTIFMEAGAMDMTTTPNPFTISTAGCNSLQRKLRKFIVRKSVAGSLKIPIWPSQASALVNFACTPQLVNGRYQLPSYTVDMFDGFEIRRFTGVRVDQATFTSDDSSDMLMGNFSLIAQKEDTPPGSLAAPNPGTDFPATIPYTHYHSSGQITIGGTVISGYKSISITVDNTLHMPFLESQWINRANLVGRNVNWSVVLSKENTTYRQAFVNQTAQANCLLKYVNGSNSLQFNLQSADYLDNYSVDRGWETDQYETLSFTSYLDPTSATDLAVTVV
jgi:hypothetical protein